MGTMMNKKYWNVHYSREVNFSHPGSGTTFATTVNASNTSPKNNSIIATGTVKLSPGGVIKCFNTQEAQGPSPDNGSKVVNASQIGFVDEQNEKTQYLVIINNGISTDLETINASLLVKDYYKAVV